MDTNALDLFGPGDARDTLIASVNALEQGEPKVAPIVNPTEPFAAAWGIQIRRAFYKALDINITDGVVSQGRNFEFVGGDTLYDSPRAYEGSWIECLLHFRFRINVLRGVGARKGEPGWVVYSVEENCSKRPGPMEARGTFECTQYEFVRRLIRGGDTLFSSNKILNVS